MDISVFVKNVVISFISTIMAIGLLGGQAFADVAPSVVATPANLIALEITPVCSSATSASALWQVTNKNTAHVGVTWNNALNKQTGVFDALPGISQLTTYYNASDPNNTTSFTSEGSTTSTNATAAACSLNSTVPATTSMSTGSTSTAATATSPSVTPPAPSCIDGSIQQNLVISWTSANSVTINTLQNAPLCHNITLEFSDYIMPSQYDGRGFFTTYNMNDPSQNVVNPTAFPQALFTNQSVTLNAGSNGAASMTLNLPSSCHNVQLDVYYAPEQMVIGAQGSGTSNIVSRIYMSQGSCVVLPSPSTQSQGTTGSTSPSSSLTVSGTVSATKGEVDTTGASTSATPIVNHGNGGRGAGGPGLPVTVLSSAVSAPVVALQSTLSTVSQAATPPELAYTGTSPVMPYFVAILLMSLTGLIGYDVRRDGRA